MTQQLVYTEPPSIPEGVALRLYSSPICPYAEVRSVGVDTYKYIFYLLTQRVRLILAAKNVPHDEINIHLTAQPDWFGTRINPYGQVPVIERNGKIIRESLIIFGERLERITLHPFHYPCPLTLTYPPSPIHTFALTFGSCH